ncbi:hypothetical protein F5B22DRAFT_651587 [Xylaria bambusicola]|uniref:uncharacterized protein n=1 Tax=Xylaria bambusicola TaxID=326684 RepID=UPI002007A2E6|nr:uncharacterized protein F5B22DRAFT_651587 [Xylaria bambusicola]KAI0505654.1 hypothetical protein F5B22DRAFT_651587 [Xylaria bambusicola]
MEENRGYTIKSEGINRQGNYYCAYDCGPDAPNQNAYFYHNLDGSRFYKNPDGSSYFANSRGREMYVAPDGDKYMAFNGGPWQPVSKNER